MKHSNNFLRRLGWRAGIWFDSFAKLYVAASQEPTLEDLSSEEYYY